MLCSTARSGRSSAAGPREKAAFGGATAAVFSSNCITSAPASFGSRTGAREPLSEPGHALRTQCAARPCAPQAGHPTAPITHGAHAERFDDDARGTAGPCSWACPGRSPGNYHPSMFPIQALRTLSPSISCSATFMLSAALSLPCKVSQSSMRKRRARRFRSAPFSRSCLKAFAAVENI